MTNTKQNPCVERKGQRIQIINQNKGVKKIHLNKGAVSLSPLCMTFYSYRIRESVHETHPTGIIKRTHKVLLEGQKCEMQ